MKQVGSRREPQLSATASGILLAQGARFSESISHLSPTTFGLKGVYRFRSHEEANRMRRTASFVGWDSRLRSADDGQIQPPGGP
jgi:hypothetical protein